ncbi:MAG: hypothetical protein IH991_18455, partial [Planctomycetes bacterium]|nr:hypothetical protein [Planctomycetota bacterium]
MSRSNRIATNPHRQIQPRDSREQFLLQLFDRLWDRYRERVAHVAAYEKLLEES